VYIFIFYPYATIIANKSEYPGEHREIIFENSNLCDHHTLMSQTDKLLYHHSHAQHSVVKKRNK